MRAELNTFDARRIVNRDSRSTSPHRLSAQAEEPDTSVCCPVGVAAHITRLTSFRSKYLADLFGMRVAPA